MNRHPGAKHDLDNIVEELDHVQIDRLGALPAHDAGADGYEGEVGHDDVHGGAEVSQEIALCIRVNMYYFIFNFRIEMD